MDHGIPWCKSLYVLGWGGKAMEPERNAWRFRQFCSTAGARASSRGRTTRRAKRCARPSSSWHLRLHALVCSFFYMLHLWLSRSYLVLNVAVTQQILSKHTGIFSMHTLRLMGSRVLLKLQSSSDEGIENMCKYLTWTHAQNITLPTMLGALPYLSVMSRPDIAAYISILCSFIQNQSYKCYVAAQSSAL